jgi:hypothetical protein
MNCSKSLRRVFCAVSITLFIIMVTSGSALGFGENCPCFSIQQMENFFGNYQFCEYTLDKGKIVGITFVDDGQNSLSFGATSDPYEQCTMDRSHPVNLQDRLGHGLIRDRIRMVDLSDDLDAYYDCVNILDYFNSMYECEKSKPLKTKLR